MIAMLLTSLALAALWPMVNDKGVDPDADMFLVEVTEPAEYGAAADAAPAFRTIRGDGAAFRSGEADLWVIGGALRFDRDDERSRAAARVFEAEYKDWARDRLLAEPDTAAAFPVRIALVYQARELDASSALPRSALDDGGDDGPDVSGIGEAGDTALPDKVQQAIDAGTGTTSGSSDTSGGATAPVTPDQIEPPFPIRSLLLTFAFLIPWSFLTQILAGTLLHERLARRGLILLSGPYSGPAILLGLSLPYILASLAVGVAVTVAIGAGPLGLLAMLPVLLVLLAAAALVGLLARSQREMTFLLVAVTTGLATFLFLPAMFIEVHPVAFLSPVAVVSTQIRSEPLEWAQLAYATLPLALIGTALTSVGATLFREEYMFAPSKLMTRFTDGLSRAVAGRTRLLVAGILVVPFAFIGELFVLSASIMMGLRTGFLFFLIGAAAVEELLKGMVVYAHRSRPGRTWGAGLTGGLVGAGFFLGEKIALLLSLVGFGLLPQGDAALGTFGVGAGLVMLVAPLGLHIVTASITARGAARGAKTVWWFGLVAFLVHVSYNTLIVIWGVTSA